MAICKDPKMVIKALRYMVQEVAMKDRVATYGEIGKYLDISPYYAVPLVCGAMGKYCQKHNLPRLNALIVNADTGVPSKGWDKYQNGTLGDNTTFEEEQLDAWLFVWPPMLANTPSKKVERPIKLGVEVTLIN